MYIHSFSQFIDLPLYKFENVKLSNSERSDQYVPIFCAATCDIVILTITSSCAL